MYGREFVRSGSCCRHSRKLAYSLPRETYKTRASRGQGRERLRTASRGLGGTVNKALGPQEQIEQVWGWISSF